MNIQDRIPAWVNSMDIGVWQTPVHGGAETDTTERQHKDRRINIIMHRMNFCYVSFIPWNSALQRP